MIDMGTKKNKTVQHKNNDCLSKWPNKWIRKVCGDVAGENFPDTREKLDL